MAGGEAIRATDATTGKDLWAALAAAGIAVHTSEDDNNSMVWILPVAFELAEQEESDESHEEEEEEKEEEEEGEEDEEDEEGA